MGVGPDQFAEDVRRAGPGQQRQRSWAKKAPLARCAPSSGTFRSARKRINYCQIRAVAYRALADTDAAKTVVKVITMRTSAGLSINGFLFASYAIYLLSSYPVLAQDAQSPSREACAANSIPIRDGVLLEPTDKVRLIALGLEAAETVKSLLISSDAIRAAQWCLEDDALARANSLLHWRNIAAPDDGGAILDRFTNAEHNTTVYVIRVGKGQSIVNADSTPRITSNFTVIVDEPNALSIAGYFAGYPNTNRVLNDLTMRGRISKADGKTNLSVPK